MLEKRKKSNKLEFSFLEGAQAVCFSQFVYFTLFKFVFVNERLYKVDTFERKSSSSSLLLFFSFSLLRFLNPFLVPTGAAEDVLSGLRQCTLCNRALRMGLKAWS